MSTQEPRTEAGKALWEEMHPSRWAQRQQIRAIEEDAAAGHAECEANMDAEMDRLRRQNHDAAAARDLEAASMRSRLAAFENDIARAKELVRGSPVDWTNDPPSQEPNGWWQYTSQNNRNVILAAVSEARPLAVAKPASEAAGLDNGSRATDDPAERQHQEDRPGGEGIGRPFRSTTQEPRTIAGRIAGRDLPNKWRPEFDRRVAEAEHEAVGLALEPSRVGRLIDDHYRARRAADPSGPALHECGSYCGADIAARLSDGWPTPYYRPSEESR